jgi:hypothetical protein
MIAYMDFQTQAETHHARFGKLTTRLMEQTNDALNLLNENRAQLASMHLLGPLAEAFRQQSLAIEGLTENAAAEAENRAELIKNLSVAVKAISSSD